MTPVCVNPRARQNGSRLAVSEVERERRGRRSRGSGPRGGQRPAGQFQLLGSIRISYSRHRQTNRRREPGERDAGYLSCASPA